MKDLSEVDLQKRGDRKGLVCLDEEMFSKLLAFVRMDRNRRYFISSCYYLTSGRPYSRIIWRQVQDMANNKDPELVEFDILQPKAA